MSKLPDLPAVANLCSQVAKKLVNSDFKNNRVGDPTKINDKQQKKVKQFCKEYFDKAVDKHRSHAKKKADRPSKEPESKLEDTPNVESDEAVDVKMSDDEEDKPESMAMETDEPGDSLKRKRGETIKENGESMGSPVKRPRSSTPPPPPPPMTPGDREEGKQGPEGGACDIKQEHDDLADVKQDTETPPPPPPPPEDDSKPPIKTEDGESLPSNAVAKEEHSSELEESQHDAKGKT